MFLSINSPAVATQGLEVYRDWASVPLPKMEFRPHPFFPLRAFQEASECKTLPKSVSPLPGQGRVRQTRPDKCESHQSTCGHWQRLRSRPYPMGKELRYR